MSSLRFLLMLIKHPIGALLTVFAVLMVLHVITTLLAAVLMHGVVVLAAVLAIGGGLTLLSRIGRSKRPDY